MASDLLQKFAKGRLIHHKVSRAPVLAHSTAVFMIDDARNLFDEKLERESFSWTAMISGYVGQKMAKEALDLYRLMHIKGNVKFCLSLPAIESVNAAASIV